MFESSVDSFIAIVCSSSLLLVTTYLFVKWIKTCNTLPPGPRPLPLVGNILQTAGKDFRDVCKEYRKIYGDIFTVHFFTTPVIVVNGFETLKEVFVENGDKFSERHTIDLMDESIGGKGIGLATGEIWKRNRRFVVRTLKDFGMGKKKLETMIHTEIEYFLDALEEEKGQPFDVDHLITASLSNVMCLLMFGQRFTHTDEEFIEKVEMIRDLFDANFLKTPSWLRYIPRDPFDIRRSIRQLNHLSDFYRKKIREHYEDFDENDQRDLIDVYIKQSKVNDGTAEDTSRINEDEMVRILHDLFVAGTDTTGTVLRYGIVCMLRKPDIQEKVFTEITENVPDNRLPNVDDMRNLPYTRAVISEILRQASVAPLAIPHRTKTNIQFRGYTIPRSAFIFPNLESVLHDATLWDAPLDFLPERFENISRGKLEQIPFGIGPRACPGENMARMELNLFFPAMLQRFRLCSPDNDNPPSFATALGTTCRPYPFKMKAVKRM